MAALTPLQAHFVDHSSVASTNCDIDDMNHLQETIKNYLTTETFRSAAQRVLKAHSIDPSQIKQFNIEIEEDGSIYLKLLSSSRKFKLLTDETFTQAAFQTTTKHSQKPREELVQVHHKKKMEPSSGDSPPEETNHSSLSKKPSDQDFVDHPHTTQTAVSLDNNPFIETQKPAHPNLRRIVTSDRQIIEEYLTDLKDQEEELIDKLNLIQEEIDNKKGFFKQTYAALTLSQQTYHQSIESLELTADQLNKKLTTLQAKIKKYTCYLSLPELKKAQSSIKKENSLKQSLKEQKHQLKALSQELAQKHLESETASYEKIGIEEFLTLFVSKKISSYDQFQQLLDSYIDDALKEIETLSALKETTQALLPYKISTFLFSSSQQELENKESEIYAYQEQIFKKKRIVRMFNRLKKTSEKEFSQMKRDVYAKKSLEKKIQHLEKKIERLQRAKI